MKNRPQTIKLFLLEGVPTGIKTVEMLNWNGKGYLIPRASLKSALALEENELDTQAVYFLMGEEEGRAVVYIGETEEFHNQQAVPVKAATL